jgi:hypothetical protein
VDSPILELMHTKSESTLHPEYHDTVLAITENFNLYRSIDKGLGWYRVNLTGGTINKATKLFRSPSTFFVIYFNLFISCFFIFYLFFIFIIIIYYYYFLFFLFFFVGV